MFCGTLLGATLRRLLPGHHLTADSRDVVKLGAGLIATQAALVLGLLVSSAKTSFDATNEGLTQSSVKLIVLDNLLSNYGPETNDIREHLRRALANAYDQVWSRNRISRSQIKGMESSTEWAKIDGLMRALTPRNESQSLLKQQALSLATDLTQLRWILYERADISLPTVFLVVLIFWFTMLFATFGMLTPNNATVTMVLLVCSLAVAGGILLILEMSHPLTGLMQVPGLPIQKALEHMGR